MPKFKHEQRVKFIAGNHIGKTGVVFGHPVTIEAGVPKSQVAEGQDVGTDMVIFVEYLVDIDGTDATVPAMESHLEAI